MKNTSRATTPERLYVWLVPSEAVLEQPGDWRIRKWDTEPFPEATHCLPSATATREQLYRSSVGNLQDALAAPTDKHSELEDAVQRAANWLHKGAPMDECASCIRDVARLSASLARETAVSASAPTIEQIVQAVAKGWCSPNNAHKTADPELAYAIAAQILALVSSPSTRGEKAGG